MSKKVSIVIPVYNGEETIKDTINSAINQTYDNVEVIVIDNKSTDNTVQIVNEFNNEKLILLQNSENLGMVGNWNECLKQAGGEYIHFLCADDCLKADCIQKKVEAIEKNDAVMVVSATEIVNENGEVVMLRRRCKKDTVFDGYKYAKKSLHRGNIFGEPSSVMFKKAIIEKTGLFATNLSYTTDWELWCRIAACGKLVYISEVLSEYRISMGNTTGSLKLKRIMDDDTRMMNNLINYDGIDISLSDIVIHKLVLSARDIARLLYMKIKSR